MTAVPSAFRLESNQPITLQYCRLGNIAYKLRFAFSGFSYDIEM